MAGKKGRGRPPQTPSAQAIRRVMHAKEVRKSRRFRAYDRLLTLAEEIDRELELAVADNPQNPEKIHGLQDRLRAALKEIIPYERPRLSRLKVSGDKNAPLFDLSGLAEKELLAMRRMLLKAKQVEETEDEDNGED